MGTLSDKTQENNSAITVRDSGCLKDIRESLFC